MYAAQVSHDMVLMLLTILSHFVSQPLKIHSKTHLQSRARHNLVFGAHKGSTGPLAANHAAVGTRHRQLPNYEQKEVQIAFVDDVIGRGNILCT